MSVVTRLPDLMIRDAVGEPLHLVQLVRRQEHRPLLRRRSRVGAARTRSASADPGPRWARRGSSSSGRCMNANTSPTFWRLPFDSSLAGRSSMTSNRSTSSSANDRSCSPGLARTSRCAAGPSCAGTARARRGGSRCGGGSRCCRAARRGRAPPHARSSAVAGRAASGSSSSFLPRSGRGSRTPVPPPTSRSGRSRLGSRRMSSSGSRLRSRHSSTEPWAFARPHRRSANDRSGLRILVPRTHVASIDQTNKAWRDVTHGGRSLAWIHRLSSGAAI